MIAVRWAVGVGALVLAAAFFAVPGASSSQIRGDLTAPAGGNPFGGAVVGSYAIRGGFEGLRVRAEVSVSAPDGYVLEGWLVDMQTGYKLSLGELDGGELRFRQDMVNPWTYGVLVITAEPELDLDPNPAMPVAGALLPDPFGQ